MGRKKRRIIVIGKVREFDEAAWKRLLLAYTYYLHDERLRAEREVEVGEDERRGDGGVA